MSIEENNRGRKIFERVERKMVFNSERDAREYFTDIRNEHLYLISVDLGSRGYVATYYDREQDNREQVKREAEEYEKILKSKAVALPKREYRVSHGYNIKLSGGKYIAYAVFKSKGMTIWEKGKYRIFKTYMDAESSLRGMKKKFPQIPYFVATGEFIDGVTDLNTWKEI